MRKRIHDAARRLTRSVGALAVAAALLTAVAPTDANAQGRARRCAPRAQQQQQAYYPGYAGPAYSGYPAARTYPNTSAAYYDPYFPGYEQAPWERNRSNKGRTVAAAAVGAGGGAVLGGIAAGKKGAIIGAIAGGVAAGVIAAKTGNNDNRFPF